MIIFALFDALFDAFEDAFVDALIDALFDAFFDTLLNCNHIFIIIQFMLPSTCYGNLIMRFNSILSTFLYDVELFIQLFIY